MNQDLPYDALTKHIRKNESAVLRDEHGHSRGQFGRVAEAAVRKQQPVATGVLQYFPDALLSVANVSFVGNEQHNPGQKLHWAKEKSADEPDAEARHLLESLSDDVWDSDGVRHKAKKAWRALADLQREHDKERAADHDLRTI